ncbi:MAG: SIS domain-containing protein [Chloroflexota bacterium]|nr:SIS domain-containing protein [Chloroflexota bacterium]
MTDRGQHIFEEIITQPTAWANALADVKGKREAIQALFAEREFQEVVFTGCGSTHYLSLAAAQAFQGVTSIRTRGLPASELILFPETSLGPGETLLVAVSRSGETTETLRAVRAFREEQGAPVVVITCYPKSTLAREVTEADVLLLARRGQEKSVAQTRSFASMLVAAQGFAGLAVDSLPYVKSLEGLPLVGNWLLQEKAGLAQQLGEEMALQRFFFLGSGPNYGLACEAMLKMKEMSLSYSEAFHFLEFRHGPKSMVDESTLVVGLISEGGQEQELAVLREMQGLGATILALADPEFRLESFDHAVAFDSGISDWARGVLYLPVLQLMAYHRAMAKGLNPDRPAHLDAVVKL